MVPTLRQDVSNQIPSMFDVVGLFSRDLSRLQHLVSKTLDVKEDAKGFPKRILYPLDFFPHSNPKHQEMVDDFIGILEEFLGTKKVEISLAERWEQCTPPSAGGKSLKEYLAKVLSTTVMGLAIVISILIIADRMRFGRCATITITDLMISASSTVRRWARSPTRGRW